MLAQLGSVMTFQLVGERSWSPRQELCFLDRLCGMLLLLF